MIATALHIASAAISLGLAAVSLGIIVRHCLIASRTPIGRLLRMKWRAP